jgi:histidyl-tRNA synthetase
MVTRVRGTHDICDTNMRNFFIEKATKYFSDYNFNHIVTPILEYSELFAHSIGENTDIISKEMYSIEQKNNAEDGKKICLRPEVTAPVIRACIDEKIERFPWKVFTYGPMFRYERPQKGRLRQFTQFNLEIVNTSSFMEDVFFIAMLSKFFINILLLKNIILKINFLGCFEDRKNHKHILGKFLQQNEKMLCQTCLTRKVKNPLRIFDCKNQDCKKLYQKAPFCIDSLCKECNEEWTAIQKNLSLLSINHIVDPSLVRGLDYYTKIVFEYSSTSLGAQDSLCGGGRYILGKRIGSKKDFNSIGVGIGIERIEYLLEQQNHPLKEKKPLNIILPISKKQDIIGIMLSQILQKKGFCTDILFEKASMSNMMKKANKAGAKSVIVIGEEEQKNNTVTLKNMTNGITKKIKQTEIYKYL